MYNWRSVCSRWFLDKTPSSLRRTLGRPEAKYVTTEGTTQKAIANPTKEFFVTMITRDITLEDCILDLIDNSVDGAWRGAGSRPIGLAEEADLSKYSISINISPESFRILTIAARHDPQRCRQTRF